MHANSGAFACVCKQESEPVTSFFENLPTRLRNERMRMGWSQQEMATIGGISLRSQSRYENSIVDIDVAYFDKLAARHVDILYVLTGIRQAGGSEVQEVRQPTYQSATEIPPELKPVTDALIKLWYSRTVSVDTLDSWRMMFERMNPFMNPEAAKVITPQQIVQDPAQVVKTDAGDLSFLSRKPGKT